MKKMFPAVLFAAFSLWSGTLTVEVKTDRPDAVYRSGDTVTVTARALEDGKPVSGLKVAYTLTADGGVDKKGSFVSDAKKPFVLKHRLTCPSALRAEFTVFDRNGKKVPLKKGYDQVRFAGGRIGAVADPEKIQPGGKRPADFDAFWDAQLKKAAQVPLKVLSRKKAGHLLSSSRQKYLNAWDVQVSCIGRTPVSGYLAMPKNAKPKSLPAILLVQGGGVRGSLLHIAGNWAVKGMIALEINAHGLPNGRPGKYYEDLKKGELAGYSRRMVPDRREDHYYLGMALRLCRALEYLRTLPEWDGKNLIICGASQGGWQAIAGAALDSQVSLCVAGVPAYADYDSEFNHMKRMPRFHFGRYIRRKNGGPAVTKKLLGIQSYFDPVCFAPRIKCDTFISVGYVDLSCPATSVYALYNSLPKTIKKHIDAFPGGVHAASPATAGNAEIIKITERSKK